MHRLPLSAGAKEKRPARAPQRQRSGVSLNLVVAHRGYRGLVCFRVVISETVNRGEVLLAGVGLAGRRRSEADAFHLGQVKLVRFVELLAIRQMLRGGIGRDLLHELIVGEHRGLALRDHRAGCFYGRSDITVPSLVTRGFFHFVGKIGLLFSPARLDTRVVRRSQVLRFEPRAALAKDKASRIKSWAGLPMTV